MRQEQIGFIGLGIMGQEMARVLMAAGHTVRVYNRTPGRADDLVQEGAQRAGSPGEAVTAGGIAVTMVADDHALREVTQGENGFLGRLGEGGLHLSMSTVSPETSRALAAAHAERGELYLAAPVFGRPQVAALGNLWICCSGAAEARERAHPLLAAMGRETFEFGEDPGAANVVKLAGNFTIIAATEAMAEAYTLADKAGIRPEAVHEFLTTTLFPVPIYQNYGQMISENRFTPAGFRLRLGLKDISLALDTAHAHETPMPLAELLRDRLTVSVEKGRGEIDVAGLAMEAREAAGL